MNINTCSVADPATASATPRRNFSRTPSNGCGRGMLRRRVSRRRSGLSPVRRPKLVAGATMRIRAKSVLIPILLLGTGCGATGEEKVHREFVPGTKITLKARKAQYFLGENILLDYQIEY